MSRDALKFTDLDAFLAVMEEMGYDGEVQKLIYEEGQLPYCSAFFVPLYLLPPSFDQTKLDVFGGSITQIEVINYLGTEQFMTDFMIFPLSRTGYLELGTSFVEDTFFDDPEGKNMNFVVNIEDGGGKEFYLAKSGNLIGLVDNADDEPQIFKTAKQVAKQIDQLRQKHAESCQVYVLEIHEFEARKKALLSDSPD